MTAVIESSQNVTDSSLYLDGIPHDRFAALRAQPGIAWHPYGDDDSAGFWAVTRHRDIKEVSKNAETYSPPRSAIQISGILKPMLSRPAAR